MTTIRSENHYLRHGDVIILVDKVLFKLHRDILETHSEYFQSEFNATEMGNDQTISDEHPLVLPANVCTIESFEIICDFLYPRAIGIFPAILIQEVEKWEAVLQAAVSLQMRGLREHILAHFEGDILTEPALAARLLGLAVRYDESPDSFKFQCLHALVFLRRSISPIEISSLGEMAASQVINIRDRIRILIATSHAYWTTIHRHYLCVEGASCQTYIHEGVFNNVKDADPLKEYFQTDSTIFEIPQDARVCFHCNSIRAELASTMAKQELEEEIRRCAVGLRLLRAEE